MPKQLSVFDKHQLRIAKDTLKMTDVGAYIMGGMTKAQAVDVIKRFTGVDRSNELKSDGTLQEVPGGSAYEARLAHCKEVFCGK